MVQHKLQQYVFVELWKGANWRPIIVEKGVSPRAFPAFMMEQTKFGGTLVAGENRHGADDGGIELFQRSFQLLMLLFAQLDLPTVCDFLPVVIVDNDLPKGQEMLCQVQRAKRWHLLASKLLGYHGYPNRSI